jgi:TPP-dependent pyruvate/acetoin dehydrogenase alpha subunit
MVATIPNNKLATEFMSKLYEDMLNIRMVEETIAQRYSEQEMRCPVHLSIGQEAVAVGVCAALSTKDYALTGHRGHAHYLAKGGALKPMLAEIYGKQDGCCKGKGGSMHLIDINAGFLGAAPIVGSTIPIGVGVAMGTVMKGDDNITVIFFGDGATEEGVFHESLNFAVLKKLPVLFVCENNLYSVYSPLSVRQPANREIAVLAQAHGIDSRQADGNDVEEVYRVTAEAVSKIRGGGGPIFLEFSTYRWREHCGPNYDNDAGYRTESEFESWKKKCPITSYSAKLMAEGILDTGKIESVKTAIKDEIDAAFQFAKESPFPNESLMLQEVFAA